MGGKKNILGLVIGLGGCLLTGYALYSILSSAGCAAALDKSCPVDGVFTSVWMLPVGVIAAMAGMFMGGGFLVFAGLFMAIGLGALIVGILGQMPDMPFFPWLFGGLFFAGGLVPFFLGAFMRRSAAAKQVMAAELMRSGAKGVGTITNVSDTGITINNNPRITITMRIEPNDGAPAVERNKTVTVSRVQIPQVGARYPAWYDRNDPDKWMYGTDMDASQASAEVKEMFARAAAGGAGAGAAASAVADAADGPVEELAQLTELWKSGALTDTEFAAAKARLLAKIGR
jgi:membrane protein implicated in regulation of membrane protease activity